ncbi:hypothetical protein B0J12DRAFT_51452 [Macrophomina phaseolina]|uniref:Uncharacterized protein n=1 Tax=Macrophomina phaseolina TaxID=35725 RepID=A0ABQ8GEF6_9PEZI|nr:hypothetical protein B0J12DRAFT_51452 [Macrophomina phaseolina]
MQLAASLLTLALTGMGLAAPAPAPFPEGTLEDPPAGTTNYTSLIESKGPGYNVLLAVETAPNKDKAIVAWAYGRFQCTERQLVSKGANDFCDKVFTFDRVPTLDEDNEPTGKQEKITIAFRGCGDLSKKGDYSNIVVQDDKGFYDCNGDRELHGCDYNNSELDTDLAAFLSVSLSIFFFFFFGGEGKGGIVLVGRRCADGLAVRQLCLHAWR